MSRGTILLSVLLGLLVQGHRLPAADGNDLTGLRLLKMCDAPQGETGWLVCTAYFRGYSDAVVTAAWAEKENRVRPCVPEGLTSAQVSLIVLKFMREKPEVLHAAPASLSFAALAKAFPCP